MPARSRRGERARGRAQPDRADGIAKLREIVHDNFMDYSAIESELTGYDACFFCLGVSSIGMDEERYRHLTYDITLAAATTLARLNPGMVFTYVTGRSTDSTEQGPMMWARVKGKTENDLLKLPFKAAYMFRPAGIQPLHGVRSKTGWIQAIYVVTAPLLVLAGPHLAEIHDHDRTGRPRHDQGRARRLSQGRCWRARISMRSELSFRGSPTGLNPMCNRTSGISIPGSKLSLRPGMTAEMAQNPSNSRKFCGFWHRGGLSCILCA